MTNGARIRKTIVNCMMMTIHFGNLLLSDRTMKTTTNSRQMYCQIDFTHNY